MSRLTRVVAHDGTATVYTYDVFNRLVKYADHSNMETYTYDAEGVRRSKKNDVEDIVFVSDTTGSLSYTLAEFDSEDNFLTAYTRADTLISQMRMLSGQRYKDILSDLVWELYYVWR